MDLKPGVTVTNTPLHPDKNALQNLHDIAFMGFSRSAWIQGRVLR